MMTKKKRYFQFLKNARMGNKSSYVSRLQRYFGLTYEDALAIVSDWEKHPEYKLAWK